MITLNRAEWRRVWMAALFCFILAIFGAALLSCTGTIARQEVRQTQASHSSTGQDSGILRESGDQQGFLVNQDWIDGYDSLLNTYGKTLSPPRKKGDRDGIVTEGRHYRVSDAVMERFLVLNQRRVNAQSQ